MKKPDLGQALSILANVGVIAAIIFLGIELRQNNAQIETQIALNQHQIRVENIGAHVHDEALAAAQIKLEKNEALTETEEERLYWWYATRYVGWELNHRFGTGNPRAYAESFRDTPASLRFWNDYRRYLQPDFVQWLEAEVIPLARE